MKTEFKPYFRIEKDTEEIVARVYQEERAGVADLRLRTVKADRYPRQRISADNWEYNRHSTAEKEATMNAFDLADDGYQLIVWISPEDHDIYFEGRLNIMLPVNNNGEMGMEPWGIPLPISSQDSRKLAERLLKKGGVSMDPITNEESVRKQPIGFRLEKGEKWLDRCRQIIPELAYVWDYIEQGKVEQNMQAIIGMIRYAKQVAGDDNYRFEVVMRQMGLRLNVAGGHGGSWLGSGVGQGIWQYKISRLGGIIKTDIIKVNGKSVCPICGMEVDEGATWCSKCGVELRVKAND